MKHILDDAINKYLDPNIPEWGEDEEEADLWAITPEGQDPSLPGEGLARHDMLYIGEGCNKMFLIVGGKIVWTFSTGKGWEYDDVWMTPDGNILFTRMPWAGEVTPQKKLVWRYDCGENREVHAIQPIGDDKALMVVNGHPPKLVMIDRKTGNVLWEKVVPYNSDLSVHGQFRRMRYTPDGTYLMSYLQEEKVVEYDEDMNVVWQYNIHMPWAAIRLKNGNTLITAESQNRVIEVNKAGEIVWEFHLSEIPEEYRLNGSQSCVRLDNGNTILCSRGDVGKTPQLVEVTPDKKVVWVLKDWKNLGPATTVHILHDGVDPRIPSSVQR